MDIYVNENEFKIIDLKNSETWPENPQLCLVERRLYNFLAFFFHVDDHAGWFLRFDTKNARVIQVKAGDKYIPVNLIFDDKGKICRKSNSFKEVYYGHLY